MNIGSREIVLWLSEPQHQALTRALGEMGTDIETIMQARLEELYSRTVPMTERLRISREMEAERLEQQRQWEASRTFSVFRIMEHGQDSFLMKEILTRIICRIISAVCWHIIRIRFHGL